METTTKDEFDQLLTAMVERGEGISDLLFVTGNPPQTEVHGELKSFALESNGALLTSPRIEGFAKIIINNNPRLVQDLTDQGSCDCSYSLPASHRFRVNIYRQNGNHAMVLRRLQSQIPSMESLQLPPVFRQIIKEKTGLIFVTGGTGSGKTTTLAAMLNEINQTSEVHVVTLEDPIEFLHPRIKSTFSQREMGRDFFNFPDGLRAALRQAPKVIFVGEIRDRESLEIALTAGETGHVVYSTLHTINAGQTINRILAMFGKDEEQQVRARLTGSLRYIVSQRLVPQISGGRLLVTELMGSSMRSREVIELGENEKRRLGDIIEAGQTAGWHSFDQSLLKAYEDNLITEEMALLHCTSKSQLSQRLDTVNKQRATEQTASTLKMKEEKRIYKPLPPSLPKLTVVQPAGSAPLPDNVCITKS
jgi:twitching motility protein PilT